MKEGYKELLASLIEKTLRGRKEESHTKMEEEISQEINLIVEGLSKEDKEEFVSLYSKYANRALHLWDDLECDNLIEELAEELKPKRLVGGFGIGFY